MEILHQIPSFVESHSVLSGFVVSAISAGVAYFLARRKNKLELKNLEISTEKSELEVANGFVEFYKENAENILVEMHKLKKEVEELKVMVEQLKGNQCKGDACPDRIELSKIYEARIKRKISRAKRKKENE